jgi:YidC/Oxa1 family membrane protein insertase
MGALFHEILFRPLFNGLVFLYNTVALQDLGVAILLLTVVIRIILYPLFYKSLKNQALLQKIQPDIKRIQETHKGNRERQAQALLALYQTHKVNPFSSFFLIFLQLPVLIALYQVFLKGFSPELFEANLYSFITEPSLLTHTFLGLIDVSHPNILVVGLAAAAQYLQGKLALPKASGENDAASRIGRQMVFIGPVLTLVILYNLPSAIGIYWFTTSVFSILQQVLVNRSIANATLPTHGGTATESTNTP